jgi:hypothetical protein
MLAGVTDKNLDMFAVNTQNLSISPSSLGNLADLTKRADHFSGLIVAALTDSTDSSDNITAADLGLADSYTISLWNYCSTTGSNTTCTKAKFNWAASALNTTSITSLTSSTGVTVTLPKELTSALNSFAVVSKWTEVVYIVAVVTCVVELLFGLVAICSRIGSCCTFLISGLSTVAIVAASVLATAQSAVVVGALDSTTKAFGVHASFNTSFLSITWLAVLFSLAGGLFWLFTICCCASDHHSNRGFKRNSRAGNDNEKLIPAGMYQPVGNQHAGYAGQQSGVYAPQTQREFGVPLTNVKPMRMDGAYEPYSHTVI